MQEEAQLHILLQFQNLAKNSQQTSATIYKNKVDEVNLSYEVAKLLVELMRLMELIQTAYEHAWQAMVVKTCGICGEYDQRANVCQRSIDPTSEFVEQVNDLLGFQPWLEVDPYSNMYNLGY